MSFMLQVIVTGLGQLTFNLSFKCKPSNIFISIGKPECLPEGSYLVVKFQDVSIMDIAATLIAEQRVLIENYDPSGNLKYTLTFDRPTRGNIEDKGDDIDKYPSGLGNFKLGFKTIDLYFLTIISSINQV